MDVTLYAPPVRCTACSVTQYKFRQLGVPFTHVVADDVVADRLRGEGYAAFPVVTVDCGDGASWSWSGFRYDSIVRLAELI